MLHNIHPDSTSLKTVKASRSSLARKVRSDLTTAVNCLGVAFQPALPPTPERSPHREAKKVLTADFFPWACSTLRHENTPREFLDLGERFAKKEIIASLEPSIDPVAETPQSTAPVEKKASTKSSLSEEKADSLAGLLVFYVCHLAKQAKDPDRVLFDHGGLNESALAEALAKFAAQMNSGGANPLGGQMPETLRKRLRSIREKCLEDWRQSVKKP